MRTRNHSGRWCKHQLAEYGFARCLPKDKWIQSLPSNYGGPVRAWRIHLKTVPSVLVTCNTGSAWLNLYARTARRGERIAQATGPIERSGWNTTEQRWSYGQGPIGCRELTRGALRCHTLILGRSPVSPNTLAKWLNAQAARCYRSHRGADSWK